MARGAAHPEPGRGWWNATGWEACTVCGERFDYEVEVRCADCDGPVCPLCAVEVTVRRTRVCAPCSATPEES